MQIAIHESTGSLVMVTLPTVISDRYFIEKMINNFYSSKSFEYQRGYLTALTLQLKGFKTTDKMHLIYSYILSCVKNDIRVIKTL